MEIINIGDAKTNLSKLVEKVLSGKEVIIGRRNKPLVRLSPFMENSGEKRRGGQLKGKIKIAADFDELPKELEDMFSGLIE